MRERGSWVRGKALLATFLLGMVWGAHALAAPPLLDFTAEASRSGWQATHDIETLAADSEGLRIVASGNDPYVVGPPVPVPIDQPLWLRLRLKTTETGMGQVFYFGPGAGPTEPDSVRFPVRSGRWEEVRLPLPPSRSPLHLRFDPPGGPGATTVVAWIDIVPRVELPEPSWPRPTRARLSKTSPRVRSGLVELVHGGGPGGFLIRVAGQPMAIGNNHPWIGYQSAPDMPLRWLDLAARARTVVARSGGAVTVKATAKDDDGATWTLTQKFGARLRPSAIDVVTTVSVDRERLVAHLPLLSVFPGATSFGTGKGQALLSGVEYLDRDEPSSSEADLTGRQALRYVPDRHQVTLPLMALQAQGLWVALAWEPSPDSAALFDSPDRHFASGGHLLGLVFPGAQGETARAPGRLLPSAGQRLAPGVPVTLRAAILGGRGRSIVPALQAWVASRGLPALPETGGIEPYARLAATGWLDSKVRDGERYRHAYPGDFTPQAAGDAAFCQDWLVQVLEGSDAALAGRLREAAAQARDTLAPTERFFANVGHVTTFAAPLVYGGTFETLEKLRSEARRLLERFAPDGTIPYRARPGGLDYARTHFASHANGLTAPILVRVLSAAALTGDPDLVREGLRRLRQLHALYRHTVPRGAQTWEVPLHTPDILASGHLVTAFVLGYELSGRPEFLEAARYWAWTGVPFTYLAAPTEESVGLYATTPVLGATQWIAPNWIGLPVQWCGLVYADALYDLAWHEPQGIWRKLADGIAVSGIQQSWPIGANAARQGLLPDSFHLVAQIRNDVAINPATVQVPVARALGRPICERRMLSVGGPFVFAPGAIERKGARTFVVQGWPTAPYGVLVTGLKLAPRQVLVNGKPVEADYRPEGWLLLTLSGTARVELRR